MSPDEKDSPAVLAFRVRQLESEVVDLKHDLTVMEKRERSKLLGGIMVLGSIVTALLGALWAAKDAIIKAVE